MLLLLSLFPAALAATEDSGSILRDAYALEEGESLQYLATLTGEIVEICTPYNYTWGNLTVDIVVEGYEYMPIRCYRLAGEGAEWLGLGDIITVTGTLTNYYGTIEFAQGCILDDWIVDPGCVTVYCFPPAEWEQCYIYWWDSAEENPVWPGIPMEWNGDLWICSVPADISYVVFNNGEYEQSPDMYLPGVEQILYFYDGEEWLNDDYQPLPDEYGYYVAGSAGLCGVAWLAGYAENRMDAGPGDVYYKVFSGIPAGIYELKITKETWEQSWGADGTDCNYIVEVEQDDSTVLVYFDTVTEQIYHEVRMIPTPVDQTYYLVGWINGEEHGCDLDWENMGQYPFVDGELTVYFEEDSYVFLKTEGNGSWFMTDTYVDAPSATFRNAETGTADRMRIPGNVFLTLSLTENADGSITLSYTEKQNEELDTSAEIIDAAYALAEGEMLDGVYTLTGEIIYIDTPYSIEYDNITVTIQVPGSEDQPIRCYRVRGEGAEYLQVGNTITVTGELMNYRGTIEFTTGCYMTWDFDLGIDPPVRPTPWEIIDAAYELAPGDQLPYQAALTGRIVEIVTPYDEYYHNITVTIVIDGRENKPIVCFRMRGDGTETLQLGDVITVHGTIQNYARYDIETGDILYTTVEFSPCTLEQINPSDSLTLYCWTPRNWGCCYVYAWDSDGNAVAGSWPGTEMNSVGNRLWCMEIPASAVGVVFNDGFGGHDSQTDDLCLPTDDRNMFVVQEETWEALSYYDPDWDLESLALVGDGLPGIPVWYPDAPEGNMTRISAYVYEKIIEVPSSTSMNFKIAGNDCWDDQWIFGSSSSIELGQMIELDRAAGSQDMMLNIDYPCTLKFTVDLSPIPEGGKATLLVEDLTPIVYRKVTVIVPDDWQSVFAYTWDPEILGTYPGTILERDDQRYSILVPENMINLIISGVKADGTIQKTDDLHLEPNGKNVTIITEERQNMPYTRIIYGDVIWKPVYRVVGNSAWMGWWDAASDAGKMVEVAPGVYQKCFEDVKPGHYEYKITINGVWDDAIGDAGDNLCFDVTQTCDVTITLTVENGNYYTVDVSYSAANIGDISGDGRVNLGDVSKLYAHIRGGKLLTDPAALESADFNGDGSINIGDAARLYAFVRGSDPRIVVEVAYRLAKNQQLPMNSTLTGQVLVINEPYDPIKNCITVTMVVPGCDRQPLLCTRLTGEDAKNISENDNITVVGTLRNFYGVVEFQEGCRLVAWEDVPSTTELMEQIVDEAYALGLNQTMDHSVTLTGYVRAINQPYTSGVPYISVTIAVPDKEDKPIVCYRMLGEGLDQIRLNDIVTITGTLRNYNGSIEFSEGCQLLDYWH